MAGEKIQGHLFDYEKALIEAYLKADDSVLTVDLKAKFSEERAIIRIDTSISFVAEKVKDKGLSYYDPDGKPKQMTIDEGLAGNREILYRDFSELRKALAVINAQWWKEYRAVRLGLRVFRLAA